MDPAKLCESKGCFESPFTVGAFLFAAVCLIWLYCLQPGLAPYRDAGEMTCAVHTLGVAHQPGYPLYILSAKLASLLLPGNPAYKLNLFSALGGLAALMVLYFSLVPRFGVLCSMSAVLLFSLNFTLQTVSGVSEMYALNLLFAAVLLSVALSLDGSWSRRRFWLGAYVLGLAMTNRMDIVLMAPALMLSVWPGLRASGSAAALKSVLGGALFWFAGFSLYLYLLVRSGGDPLFDWSHPADLGTFLAVITRKSYGSTLDLVSKNYAAGELFWPNMKYYALHLLDNFNFALPIAAAGMFYEFTRNSRRFFITLALFSVSGPVFLYLANMPPNPHALAIVEPYYLLPDMAVALWTAAGLFFLIKHMNVPRIAGIAVSVLFLSVAAAHNMPASYRRMLFAAEDWGADALKSVPPGASLVAKKDVQIFTLWYLQTVKAFRPDIKVVAQGLSGSKWYQNSKGLWRPDLKLFNLNRGDASAWDNFNRANQGGTYVTLDAELPAGVPVYHGGLVNALYSGAAAHDLWGFYNFRWFERKYNDFFGKDLGSAYAQAIVGRAAWLNSHGGLTREEARRLEIARVMAPDLPDAPLYLGFYYSSAGDWPSACDSFRRSALVYDRLTELAVEYHALPEIKDSMSRSGAYAWLNYGVALEKTGEPVSAEDAYRRALAANPGLADAHYNMAILYWNKDPHRVYEELQAAVRIDPGHQQARYYLERMRRK